MKKAILVLTVALMATGMLTLSVSAAYAVKPRAITLSGIAVILGAGTGTDFLAGKSGNYQLKIRELPFLLFGDIMAGDLATLTPGGLYHANELIKPSGDRTWTGTWTMETAFVAGIGTGSLTFGSSWDEDEPTATWWITKATGDLSSLKGRGIAAPTDNPYVFTYEFEVQITH